MLCSVMTADRTYLLDIFYCFYICSCPWVLHELEFVSLKCISPCTQKNKHIQMPGKILTSKGFSGRPRLPMGCYENILLFLSFLTTSLCHSAKTSNLSILADIKNGCQQTFSNGTWIKPRSLSLV